jgi:2-polyprenyl-6-methoxyphenol hydroxylase-like FAD-dependent oxidoreductase
LPFDQHYDIAIVGAGLASSTIAIAMARSGANVRLIEREAEFRVRVRGEWIALWSVADARKLSLLDTLDAARTPTVGGASVGASVGIVAAPQATTRPSTITPSNNSKRRMSNSS